MQTDLTALDRRSAVVLASVGLFLLPLVFWSDLGASDLLPKRMLLYLTALGLTIVWLLRPASSTSIGLPRHPILPACAYALVGFLSLFWAANPFSGLVEAVQVLVLVVLFVALQTLLKKDDILIVCQSTSAGGLLLSAIGIAQYFGLNPLSVPSVGMPSGTFVFRNLAASYLIAAIPLALAACALDPVRPRKALWSAAAAGQALFLIYTRTRGAWLGLAGAVLLAAALTMTQSSLKIAVVSAARGIWSGRLLRWMVPSCIVATMAASFAGDHTPEGVIQRFDQQKPSAVAAATSVFSPGSDRGRLTMWRHTGRMWLDHPLLGVGLDNWEYAYPRYDTGGTGGKVTSASEPVRPHNDFVWILSELGLLGFGVYIWLLVAAWVAARRALLSHDQRGQIVSLASIVGLAALLGHSLFSFPKEQPASAAMFWLHLAIIGLVSQGAHSKRSAIGTSRLLPALAVLVSAGAVILTWRQVEFDRHWSRARAYEAVSQWTSAVQSMGLAVKQGDFDHRARFLVARYLQHLGRPAEAEAAYRQALAVHPNYAHSHHNLGGVLASQGKWADAIAHYRQALSLRPGYEEARTNLGYAYAASGRLGEAAREFLAILQANPGSETAHGNLGAVYLGQGQTASAIRHLQSAIRLRPDYTEAHNNLGLAYEQAGDVARALEAYTPLLDLWQGARRKAIAQRIEELRMRLREED